jgi:tRNA(Ile)-lysidine synthase
MTPATQGGVAAVFAARMGHLLGPAFPKHIALAVSGGGDSMAMLHLAHGWARHMGVGLWVVTIDHGLRAESAAEAEMVRAECAILGRPHATLRWRWDGQGNLQAAARDARLALIDRWRAGLEHVLFAHTEDDLAETVLLRLARGSGVEGLSSMTALQVVVPHPNAGQPVLTPGEVAQTQPPPLPERIVAGVPAYSRGFQQVRPLLGVSRAALRHYADTLKIPYVDDPSNDDPRFERVKARRILAELESLGLSAHDLAQTANRMARAAEALRARARTVAQAVLRPPGRFAGQFSGHVVFDHDSFAKVERDTQLRLLAAALQWVAGDPYRPRAAPLEALLETALSGGGGTLHGGRVLTQRDTICVFREFAAVADHHVPAGEIWDRAWRLAGPKIEGCTIAALGPDGWAQVAEKPEGVRYELMQSVPAAFDGETLVACPALDFGPSVLQERRGLASSFITFLDSR